MKDKATLIRVVRSADGEFSTDTTGKAAGRGAYLCKAQECVQKALKTRAFDRSFKGKVPANIYDELGAGL